MAKKPARTYAPTPSTRILVMVGCEHFLHTERTVQLREALAEAHGQVETVRFDGASVPAAEVLDECRTVGLLQQHKLVVVDSADQFVKEGSRPMIERYAEAPCDSCTLVLRTEKWNAGKLDKLIEQVGGFTDCDPIDDDRAQVWAVKRCAKRHGAAIEPDAATLLVERLGSDLGRIDSELAKLALSVEPGTPIRRPDVAEAVGLTREEEGFDMQATLLDGLRSRRAEPSLRQLRDMLDVSRQSPVFLAIVYMDLARKLFLASHALRAGANPYQATSQAKLWGPSKDAILGAAGRIDPALAASMLQAAVAADVAQKTGLGEPDRTLEMLTLRFTSPGAA